MTMRLRLSEPRDSESSQWIAEEACVQMELLGHNFYVFFNSETEEVNVVYKRKATHMV